MMGREDLYGDGINAHPRGASVIMYRATLCASAVFAVRLIRIVSTRLKLSSNFLLGPVAP